MPNSEVSRPLNSDAAERADHRWKFSLTKRIVLLTLVATIPGFAALALSDFELRKSRYSEIRSQAELHTGAAVSELKQIFAGAAAALNAISRSSDIRVLNSPECHQFLSAVKSRTPSI